MIELTFNSPIVPAVPHIPADMVIIITVATRLNDAIRAILIRVNTSLRKTASFWSFPYVCPEPVLVKR